MSDHSPLNFDNCDDAFIELGSAAFMVPTFLVPPAVRWHEGDGIMQRIRASWARGPYLPSSEVNAFVFSLGSSLQDDLWRKLGDINPPPGSEQEKSRLKTALHQKIMTDWLIADPCSVLNLADYWLLELHRKGGAIENANNAVNGDWHAQMAWAIVWHNDAGQSFRTLYHLTVDTLPREAQQADFGKKIPDGDADP